MDFFRAQYDARRRTRLLVGLFLLSLICLLTMANLILYFVFDTSPDPLFYVGVSAAILLIVLLSSVFKSLSLRQGGEAVAHMLHARLLAAASNPEEHRLLNVVEEMSIASGTPVPPVYVMEETAINAFAAGHSINDAVIGITRGAMEKLNRDELQGVIAHEFSHILHGDMRLNLRLIAWLHGIMVLGIVGHYVLRGASASRRNNNNAGVALFGLGLIVLGASGNFFGGLIKAAVSRQREFLADASAVQYTRNPHGIAGALKRIATDTASPVLANPATTQISHALFSEGVHLRFSSLFATHPPLEKRIRLIDPDWNGEYHPASPTEPDRVSTPEPASQPAYEPLAVALAIARAGAPDDLDISDAKDIHRNLPDAFVLAAHNPLGAAATICVLLMQDELLPMDSDASGSARLMQLIDARLPDEKDPKLTAEIIRLLPGLKAIQRPHRLPLINICLGTLRQMSVSQYQGFRKTLSGIIASDPSPDLSSWILFQLSIHHLDRASGVSSEKSFPAQTKLRQSNGQVGIFFSLLSHCGHRTARDAESAFLAAIAEIRMTGVKFVAAGDLEMKQFQQATKHLANLVEADKKQLLNAMSVCVYHDRTLTVTESELLKMTSEMLDWPLPAKIFR